MRSLARQIRMRWRRLTAHLDPVPNNQAQAAPGVGQVYVFIRTWNRPLYLWACLDSLYRCTKYPCRFILLDNHSTDPLVKQVVEGFQRRGLLHAVHFMDRNHAANQNLAFVRYRSDMGKYLVVLDGDIVLEPGEPCWLERLIQTAERHPDLAALGSAIDPRDFIDRERARRLAPHLTDQELDQLIKAHSPERNIPASDAEIITPFTPPGRLLLLRTEALDRIGLKIGNQALCQAARDAGYRVGIAPAVRHRHLSLLNFFDYPEYDFAQLRDYLRGK